MKTKYRFIFILIFSISFCSKVLGNVFGEIHSDRALYSPGMSVKLTLEILEVPLNNIVEVKYYHLGNTIDSISLNISNMGKLEWSWEPPDSDYCGYLAVINAVDNLSTEYQTSIAVDVSSNWSKFPRYGFLSDYSLLTQDSIDEVLKNLNRHHINAIQYYDWHYKHHLPVKGDPINPDGSWPDIANRTNYFSTVKRYIDGAHNYGAESMAYNLLYGAYENAESDGVATQWRLFNDENHSNPDYHNLPDSWASDIYLIDPSNAAWKNYIIDKMADVFTAFPFDGWHIDQLGDRGTRYNYGGQQVVLDQTFKQYLEQAKSSIDVPLIMNAVNQYGQSEIADSPVEILYTEVWDPNSKYSDLVSIILDNYNFSDYNLSTVLAAYVNRSLSNQSGYFNTPGVLLADAVIFAAGGSHLELGEHMLANEYFPNNNLKMSDQLKKSIVNYYDFLVAYQNLLRDGGIFNNVYLKSLNSTQILRYNNQGTIWNISKQKDNRQIFHLINFKDAKNLDWRDDSGIQSEPETVENLDVFFITNKTIAKVWLATPDSMHGVPQYLQFYQSNDTAYLTIPHLKYWNLIVAEYDDLTSAENPEPKLLQKKMKIIGNYPNPFNPQTNIQFQINDIQKVKLEIVNLLGEIIELLVDRKFTAGIHNVSWKPNNLLPSGIYICRMNVGANTVDSKKLLYLK